MYKLELTLTDDVAQKLEKLASELNVTPEELAAEGLKEKLERYESFQNAARHVLDKNAELYKRLA